MSKQAPAGCAIPFMLLFVGFWTLITGVFDCMMVWGAYRQTQALGYPTAPGVIRHSKVTTNSDSEGTTYGVDVKYAYWVDGREFTGEQYRYNQMSSSDDNAKRVVASLPVGKELPVYYNPDDPSDAVLKTGIEGSDLFMALFMMPFNIVMVGGWYFLVGGIVQWRRGVRARAPRPRANRLKSAGPLGAAVGALLAVSFLSIFAVAIPLGFNPPLWMMGSVWVFVLGAATAAGLYRWASLRLSDGE